jgi:hypothetical protein
MGASTAHEALLPAVSGLALGPAILSGWQAGAAASAAHRHQACFPALPVLALLAQVQEVVPPEALAALHRARYGRAADLTLVYLVRRDMKARVAWTFHFDGFAAFPDSPPGASSFRL